MSSPPMFIKPLVLEDRQAWQQMRAYPVVKLTRTIPLGDDALSLDSLSRYMDRWAKVTISLFIHHIPHDSYF